MLDFGFFELILIIVIAIMAIGPKDIPKVMVGFGRVVRRLQYVRFAVSQQFEDFMRHNDLEDIRNSINFEAGHVYDGTHDDFDEAAEDESYLAEGEGRTNDTVEKPADKGTVS